MKDKQKNKNDKKNTKSILFISDLNIWSMSKGIGAPSLFRTIRAYVDDGWRVFYIMGDKSCKPDGSIGNVEFYQFDAPAIKKLFKIKKVGFFAKAIWWCYFQLIALILGIKITIKNRINLYYGYEVAGVPAAKLLSLIFRKPIISRFQGTILMPHINSPFWKIRFWKPYFALKLPVDLLIMTDDGTQGDKVLRRIGSNAGKIRFWRNGVDNMSQNHFNKEQEKKNAGFSAKTKILLTVCRLEKWKGVDRAINAMPAVIKNNDAVLIIVGDGNEKENLSKLAKKLHISDKIFFLGGIKRERLNKIYGIADIFLSLYDLSNVGNPLLEAMECGLCVITIDVGDTGNLIKNGQNGILLPTGELPKLAKTINETLNKEDLMARLGREAKKTAHDKFYDWPTRMKMETDETNKLISQ